MAKKKSSRRKSEVPIGKRARVLLKKKRKRRRRRKDRPDNAVVRVVDMLGGYSAVGRLFGISHQSVHQWCEKGVIPLERIRLIHEEVLRLKGIDIPLVNLNPYVIEVGRDRRDSEVAA